MCTPQGTAALGCDQESCDEENAAPPRSPSLTAPGEEYKKAIYTKDIRDTDSDGPFEYVARPYEEGIPIETLDDQLLQSVADAAIAAVSNVDPDAQEAYGDWIRDERRLACIAALQGLRGRKLVWWLDSPRPLRVVAARGQKYELSVVGLPGGSMLPPAAYPRGSVIFCACRSDSLRCRLRFDITGKTETPIELMKRSLTFGDKSLLLSGGSCHEFIGLPVASAFVRQPCSLPLPICQSGASAGWAHRLAAATRRELRAERGRGERGDSRRRAYHRPPLIGSTKCRDAGG